MSWRWETGTPKERGAFVRQHTNVDCDWLCKAFNLTPIGLFVIQRGGDWQPEFDRDTVDEAALPFAAITLLTKQAPAP